MREAAAEKSVVGTRPLSVLIIEDSPADVELCLRELKNAGFEPAADVVETPEDFVARLQSNTYDVILSDYSLRGWLGTQALELLVEQGKDVPFILVSGSLGEEAAVECIKRGVSDYILKDRMARLGVAVRRALEDKALRERRAQAEMEVRRAKEFVENLIHTANVMIIGLDSRGDITVFNEAAESLTGYTRAELEGKKWFEALVPKESAPLIGEIFADWLTGGPLPKTFEYPIRTKSGEELHISWQNSELLEQGHRIGTISFGIDVSERKRAEQEIRRRARQQAVVAELGLRALAGGLLPSIFQEAAHGVARTLEVEYAKVMELLPEGDALLVREGVGWKEGTIGNARVGTGRDSQAGYTLLGGEPVVVEDLRSETRFCGTALLHEHDIVSGLSVVIQGSGRPFGILGAYTTRRRLFTRDDVHFLQAVANVLGTAIQRQQAEQEQARLSLAVEQAAEPVMITDTTGAIVYVNPAFERISGYTRAEAMRRNPRMLKSGKHDPEFYRTLWATITRGDVWTGIIVNQRKDGTLYQEEGTISPVRDAIGRVVNYVSVRRDVTHERQLEIQLRQAQKYEAIGQLAGGIAHDFNNVIGAVMGWAELGLQEAGAGGRLSSHFQKIHDQAERAAALTQQLLAFARRQILTPCNLNLNDTVSGMLGLLERVIGKHIELKRSLDPNLAPAHADPTQLEQVLLNLCLNARDAMPGGGKLAIVTGNVNVGEEYARLYAYVRPGPYVLLTVSDSGSGMDPETIEHIFEPFFTTKELGKGTGLGLATVYGIVKQHGGFIHVYSELGHGATFRVYLPASSGFIQRAETSESEPVRGGTETILIAEDHEGLREVAGETLEKLGYTVLLATNGEEALEVFREHADRIALALLDVVMPKLGGFNTFDQIRALRPDLPVLFATGYTAEASPINPILASGLPILQKPYQPESLARKIRELLDRSGSK